MKGPTVEIQANADFPFQYTCHIFTQYFENMVYHYPPPGRHSEGTFSKILANSSFSVQNALPCELEWFFRPVWVVLSNQSKDLTRLIKGPRMRCRRSSREMKTKFGFNDIKQARKKFFLSTTNRTAV